MPCDMFRGGTSARRAALTCRVPGVAPAGNTHKYTEATDGINVPITLAIGSQSVDLLAKLDTGAAHCIFERKYAEILGLEVESGRLQRFRTVAGSFAAYQHEVAIQTLGIEFPAVSFSPKIRHFSRNFLGRSGGLTGFASALWTTTLCLFVGQYQSCLVTLF